jgi:hypothetical protein
MATMSCAPIVPRCSAPLTRWDRLGLVVLAVVLAAFACLVEKRSAFMQRRMTDAGVYFRAAWAVRTGADLYQVADENNWHYNYPPLLAILLVPLADAPAGMPRDLMLPYPVLVAMWFLLNLLCLIVAVHWLAQTLEETIAEQGAGHSNWTAREWWTRRLTPLLICLAPVAHTLMRGQVNLILLLLLAGMLRSLVRGHSGKAGVWLAGAICLKIIPAFLLLYPLWRRDLRFLGGCASGLAVGLFLIPTAVFGPAQTATYFDELARGVLAPGLTHQGDSTRAKELTDMTGTGSQSFVVVWHNTLNPDRETRPAHASPWLRMAAFGSGAVLALLTVWAWRRRQPHSGPQTYVAWGALTLVMIFVSPVSHLHYFSLCLPLVMGLLALYPPRGWLTGAWLAGAGLFLAAHTLPHLEPISYLRDFGLATYVGLLLWVAAILALARKGHGAALHG